LVKRLKCLKIRLPFSQFFEKFKKRKMTKKFDKLSLSDEKLQRIESNRQKENTFLQTHIQTDRQT
jgi:hypothetical protein